MNIEMPSGRKEEIVTKKIFDSILSVFIALFIVTTISSCVKKNNSENNLGVEWKNIDISLLEEVEYDNSYNSLREKCIYLLNRKIKKGTFQISKTYKYKNKNSYIILFFSDYIFDAKFACEIDNNEVIKDLYLVSDWH